MAKDNPTSLNRRSFLKLGGFGLLAVMGGMASGAYFENEVDTIVVEHIPLPVAGLPPALEGFRIVQISDIHLGPITSIDMVRQAVQMINQLSPDLVVLTGDYIETDIEYVYELAPVLAQLNARYGIYSILGNHERWADFSPVRSALARERLPLLVNEGVLIAVGNARLYLAGLDDGWSGVPDPKTAMQNCPADTPAVVLMHEPDFAPQIATDSRVCLQLSGHGHGGQVRLPFTGPLYVPRLARVYPMGLYKVRDMWLYTNRGLGTVVFPLRINCAPEITEISLYRM